MYGDLQHMDSERDISHPDAFEKALNVPKPQCCSQGDCCKGASPSTPYHQLLQRAGEGDEFAQGFFSLMIPYSSHEEARAVVPDLVERTLKAARKDKDFQNNEADVVFYHCRYLLPNNRCGVHEDRPQFCRDYPDTPYVVMAPGCAFEPWAATCKTKMKDMRQELKQLKKLKKELEALHASELAQSALEETEEAIQSVDMNHLSLLLSLTPIYLSSPLTSFEKISV